MITSHKHDERIVELRRVDLFRSCSDKDLRAIARLTFEKTVPAGRTLCREGSLGREAFVIVEGQAEVASDFGPIAMLGPGDVCGEMALLDSAPRAATVTAITPVTLLVMSSREFEALLSSSPGVARRILAALSARVRAANGLRLGRA